MSAVILDGKALGLRIEAHLAERVTALKNSGIEPHLAVVLAGDDPASHVYVRNKQRACERCGIKSTRIDLPDDVSQEQLMLQAYSYRNHQLQQRHHSQDNLPPFQ